MTDAEISRRLALGIGWEAHDGRIYHAGTAEQRVEVLYTPRHAPAGHKIWRRFDYRDPAVIWPIAERYNCFPSRMHMNGWSAFYHANGATIYVEADTAAKAVAIAVIKAHEVKK